MYILDLELRKDIDDFMTLIYALETNKEISGVSIHNPSIKELTVLNKTLLEFNKAYIPVFYTGNITEYSIEEDIHISLAKKFDFNMITEMDSIGKAEPFDKIPKSFFKNKIVFCGGSLFTLAQILKDNNIEAYIQGGYAGESIVGAENVLKKFKKRKEVPSWNMNLDEESTNYVLNTNNLKFAHFISKNVCHNSWIELSDIKNKDSKFYQYLDRYFQDNEYKSKCMHDLVAFMSIFDKSFIGFKKVDILSKESKRTKWYAEINENSNKAISTNLDMDKLKEKINKEL